MTKQQYCQQFPMNKEERFQKIANTGPRVSHETTEEKSKKPKTAELQAESQAASANSNNSPKTKPLRQGRIS